MIKKNYTKDVCGTKTTIILTKFKTKTTITAKNNTDSKRILINITGFLIGWESRSWYD